VPGCMAQFSVLPWSQAIPSRVVNDERLHIGQFLTQMVNDCGTNTLHLQVDSSSNLHGFILFLNQTKVFRLKPRKRLTLHRALLAKDAMVGLSGYADMHRFVVSHRPKLFSGSQWLQRRFACERRYQAKRHQETEKQRRLANNNDA
jgi:hypothetical protein